MCSRKEILENLRDRRTLMSALLFGPLFGPLLFGAMVSRMLDQTVLESDVPLQITISGGRTRTQPRRATWNRGRQAQDRAAVGKRRARRRTRLGRRPWC